VVEQWRNENKTGRKGASNYYSDVAMPSATRSGNATMGTIQSVFHLPGRQAEGFLESLFTLIGIELEVPDHSTKKASFKQAVSGTASSTKGESCSFGALLRE
jgi:hypothetical protein